MHLLRLYAPSVTEATFRAPVGDVYAVLADPATYPDWLVGADHMRSVDDAFPEPGAEFQHTVGAGPVKVDDRTESLANEENRRILLRVHVGIFQAEVEFRLVPDGAGTAVRFTERPTGLVGLLTPLLRPTLRARNAASLHRLRDLLDRDRLR